MLFYFVSLISSFYHCCSGIYLSGICLMTFVHSQKMPMVWQKISLMMSQKNKVKHKIFQAMVQCLELIADSILDSFCAILHASVFAIIDNLFSSILSFLCLKPEILGLCFFECYRLIMCCILDMHWAERCGTAFQNVRISVQNLHSEFRSLIAILIYALSTIICC